MRLLLLIHEVVSELQSWLIGVHRRGGLASIKPTLKNMSPQLLLSSVGAAATYLYMHTDVVVYDCSGGGVGFGGDWLEPWYVGPSWAGSHFDLSGVVHTSKYMYIPRPALASFSLKSVVFLASDWQLVEEVIRGVKPEVVMVELDSERICLLPPGEAMAVRVIVCSRLGLLRLDSPFCTDSNCC